MQANYVQRLRIVFRKAGPTRYIGHLDLARALERSLNRARIPLAYTQGYNPRPRMQVAAALPLGFTSDSELADIWLLERIDPNTAAEQMMSKMAPGIDIHQVYEVDLSEPALQTLTREAHYSATLDEVMDLAELRRRIEKMLAADSLVRERRGKEYDLRPLILDIKVKENRHGPIQLAIRLRHTPGQTGRPDEVLFELGIDALAAHIHRDKLIIGESDSTGNSR